MLKSTLFAFILTLSFNIDASSTLVKKNFLNAILNNTIERELKNPPLPDSCHPREDTTSCIQSVCAKMPGYKCDDVQELQEVAKLCRNNFNGQCVDLSCSRMPSYKCDDIDELKVIAGSCQYVYGSSCQQVIISKLAAYKYDDVDEWMLINSSCRFATEDAVRCLEFSCSKLPSYKCDDLSEMQALLSACIAE